MMVFLFGPDFWVHIGSSIATSSPVPDFSMLDRNTEKSADVATVQPEPEAEDKMAVQVRNT